MRATPTGAAVSGVSAAAITASPICSDEPIAGSLPRGARSRAKTFGIAVHDVEVLFESHGSRFAKMSTRLECTQKPTSAKIVSCSGPASSSTLAKKVPAGLGNRLHAMGPSGRPWKCAVSRLMRWHTSVAAVHFMSA